MCILNWCYKHFRSQKKTCAHELDPYDETIIMCENLESYEQCLCDIPPENRKAHALKSETVNVSYYPCAPSGFSSIRASTESEKGKFSLKSEQSILLSNTTSSSIPVSFESETDAMSDSEEDDDGNYDIEFEGEEEEEDDEDCICDEEESVVEEGKSTGEPSDGEQGEEQSEYSVSVPEVSRRASSSSKSKSMSAKTKSSKKSAK
ncbi:hypothetical protein NQ314_015882 [Rhamnusium bicolor]|uniref:Uncharacterized protein n=1 Tax=Rhamnusium bicolor TaxID=1586634 RepID=A0AAV8WWZ2_9CUCU|nr:hypothetical protein NQ314_015882 [Rhamnusium bicolor]